MIFERVYHHYETWEDYQEGMYKKICFMDDLQMKEDCKLTLACPEWLWESMQFVSHNWGRAAEQNLLNINRNRQAWLGQAACCFSHGAPEYITKLAWNELTLDQQIKANKIADEVIAEWEQKYSQRYFEWQR